MDTNSYPNLAMNLSTAVEPISQLKSHSAELIKRSKTTKQPVVITQNGKVTAILQDIESYQKSKNSLNLLKLVVQGEKDFHEGDFISNKNFQKKCF